MLRFLVELLETQQRISSTRRCLFHFTERELEDVGLMASDVPYRRLYQSSSGPAKERHF